MEVTDDTGSQPPVPEPAKAADVVREIDACGLQCPGPIMKLKSGVEELDEGQALAITASDPGFAGDVAGWCNSTGNRLVNLTTENGRYRATVARGKAARGTAAATSEAAASTCPTSLQKNKTIVVFSGDFDRAMAAFIIANGAAAMGSNVTLFFTFWGLNILRRDESVKVEKSMIENMFGWMMPRGAERLKLLAALRARREVGLQLGPPLGVQLVVEVLPAQISQLITVHRLTPFPYTPQRLSGFSPRRAGRAVSSEPLSL